MNAHMDAMASRIMGQLTALDHRLAALEVQQQQHQKAMLASGGSSLAAAAALSTPQSPPVSPAPALSTTTTAQQPGASSLSVSRSLYSYLPEHQLPKSFGAADSDERGRELLVSDRDLARAAASAHQHHEQPQFAQATGAGTSANEESNDTAWIASLARYQQRHSQDVSASAPAAATSASTKPNEPSSTVAAASAVVDARLETDAFLSAIAARFAATDALLAQSGTRLASRV
jgi:hypothetical protein